MKSTGKVKWFNDKKGFGLFKGKMARMYLCIIQQFSQRDINLLKGQAVEFDIVQGPKGPQASNVTATA